MQYFLKGNLRNVNLYNGIMMDVNAFKYINDNFGHSMGDKAICTLGNILF